MTISCFEPIADRRSQILILGSMPGVRSLQRQQYYAHQRNTFWPVMSALLGVDFGDDFSVKKQCLLEHGIALWDVLQNCSRPGSLDSRIDMETIQVNDFAGFFEQSPAVKAVFFNGAKAEAVYKKQVLINLPEPWRNIHYQRLPSTSPAHAALSFEDKLAQWRSILPFLPADICAKVK